MRTITMEISPGKFEPILKECRTVSGRTCKCCHVYIQSLCNALFATRNELECVGFQCFDCERAQCETWYPHATRLGIAFRLRSLDDGVWVVHERHADAHGWLDVAVSDVDDCDTEEQAADAWILQAYRNAEVAE